MVLLRPSLTLVLDLDEHLASEESIQEIKRTYAHIGTPVIRTHPPTTNDAAPINVAQLRVSMGTYRYLQPFDEESEARWSEIVEPWIGSMLHKVGNNMKVFNDRQRKIGLPEIVFERIELDLQGSELVIDARLNPTCMIDPALRTQVRRARAMLSKDAFTEAVRISMPPDDEYERQRIYAWNDWTVTHPGTFDPMPEAPLHSTGKSQPKKSRDQLLKEDIAAKSFFFNDLATTDFYTLPRVRRQEEPQEPERFTFDVSYVLWEVTLADGSKLRFDSSADAFIDRTNREAQ